MATNSPFQNPNLPLVSIFSELGLNEREVESLIPKLAPAFQRSVISVIAEQIGKPRLIEAKTPIFEIYRQPNDWAAATIASRTQSGTDLVLGWSDPNFQSIRVGNRVQAQSGAIGIVKSKDAGTATIGFFANSNGATAFNLSTDFLIGELASDRGNITDRDNRKQDIETFFTTPVNYKNIVGSYSDAVTINASEAKQYTYVKEMGGKNYYALAKVTQMLGRMQQTYSLNMITDAPAVFNSATPQGGSLIWQIKNQGGTARSFSTELTERELNESIDQYINTGGYAGNELVVVCGTGYLGQLQRNVFKQYVTTAGTTNVLGGSSVKGIDIVEYAYNGMHLKFVVDPILNNPNMFGQSQLFAGSQRSYSAMWLNPQPTPTEQGGTMPFVSDYYYISPDMIVTEINGMTDMQGNPVKKGVNGSLSSRVEVNWNKTTQLSNPAQAMYHYASA